MARPECDTDEPTRDTLAAPPATAQQVHHRVRTLGLLLLAGYLMLLGWLALRPSAADWTSPANLTPFASVGQAMTLGALAGLRQLVGGLLPLAPLGVLLPLAGGRLRTAWLPSFLRTVGGSALLATALEILRGWAPGHVLNVDNILLGTVGVALCHLALAPLARTLLLRDHDRRHDRRDHRGQHPGTRPALPVPRPRSWPRPHLPEGLGQGRP